MDYLMDESGIKLGDVQNALVIAKRCHVIPNVLEPVVDEEDLRHFPSLELTKTIKDLSQSRQQSYAINTRIHEHLLNNESADYIRPDILDNRIAQLNTLLQYFSDVISNSDKMVARLHKQTIDPAPSLRIDASCQRHFTEVFQIFAKLLNNYSKLLVSLQHTRDQFKFKHNLAMINKFSEMVQVLMECKESYQTLMDHFQLQ